ncbi:unnamed protein product [Cladocopium goreaui]|uniref:Conserved oligomeric Golgi complex subunit 3 n=1 Tax=Cladocopium goreaui TaxID=2562237 RepID=A0A9P1GB16_9DINO|nr:unnamed protein product [Cladocopium goreaui]
MVHALSQVEAEHRELDRKTTWLRGHCQETLKSSNGLALYAQQIAERLNTLCSFESIAQELDDSTLLSKPAQLERLLQRLEAAASFVESRYDFFDAKNCRSTCDHLRNRVCILMRSTLMHSLEVADSQVQDILWEQEEGTTSVDTQIFYTSFHMIAPTIKTFMSVLRKQAHLHQQYAATLDAAEAALADLRKRLPSSHWESLQEMNPDLLELVRHAINYLLDTCSREQRCFEAFFEPRLPQEALDSLLSDLCGRCSEVLLPALQRERSWELLANAAELLKAELQDFRGALQVRLALRHCLATAQRQLLILARQELSTTGLDGNASVSSSSLDAALKVLAACYRVLEAPDFESLAHMVLSGQASFTSERSLPSQLLHLSQLLRLREQLAAFEDDLLSAEVPRPTSGVASDMERLASSSMKRRRFGRHLHWEKKVREVCDGVLEHVIFGQLHLEVGRKGVDFEERCSKFLPPVAAHFRAALGQAAVYLLDSLKERILQLHLLEAGGASKEAFAHRLQGIFEHAAAAHFSYQRCVDGDGIREESGDAVADGSTAGYAPQNQPLLPVGVSTVRNTQKQLKFFD